MPIQTINLGSYPNDGTGDDLRTAFTKVNTNFQTLFSEGAIINGTNLGTGTSILRGKNNTTTNLEFKTLTSDSSILIAHDANTVRLVSLTKLINDPSPRLGANLDLNGRYVYGGDTQTTVHSLDVPVLSNFLSTILSSNQLNLDLGTMVQPTGYLRAVKGYPIDLNGTGILDGFSNALQNDYDFGEFSGNNSLTVGAKKLTLNTNLTVNGGAISLVASATTNITLPTTGTLAIIDSGLDQFSMTTSSQLRSVMTDFSGFGSLVFNSSPLFDGTMVATNISAGGYAYISGNLAINGNKFEVSAATGNTHVAGDLTVSGNLISNTVPSGYITIANLPGNQEIATGGDRQIQLLRINDVYNWWDNINHTFKPNIAGWYSISYTLLWAPGAVGIQQMNVQIFKNASSISINQNHIHTQNQTMSASVTVQLNGTNDFVALTGYTSSSTGQTILAGNGTTFSAFLISR